MPIDARQVDLDAGQRRAAGARHAARRDEPAASARAAPKPQTHRQAARPAATIRIVLIVSLPERTSADAPFAGSVATVENLAFF